MISISPIFEKIGPDHYKREKLKIGMKVMVVQKEHQKSGILTSGVVAKILTPKSYHNRGIKVMLRDGTVGRVKRILK
jgi:uncharacterized repeat protein (TIGR03833 family)